jgi:hypothetical protein
MYALKIAFAVQSPRCFDGSANGAYMNINAWSSGKSMGRSACVVWNVLCPPLRYPCMYCTHTYPHEKHCQVDHALVASTLQMAFIAYIRSANPQAFAIKQQIPGRNGCHLLGIGLRYFTMLCQNYVRTLSNGDHSV